MQLEGLVTISPDQTDLIDQVATFMGKSFLEELWTTELLKAIEPAAAAQAKANGASDADVSAAIAARKEAVSIAMMSAEFAHGAAHACSYTLPDYAGALLGYLGSEMKASGTTWGAIEDEAHAELVAQGAITPAEAEAMEAHGKAMEAISFFGWGDEESADMGFSDYIYFAAWAVDPDRRGSGAFRRLTTPVFDFADAQGIPCFLECYADHLISLYEHVGFEVFRTFEDPAFDIVQTCMVRRPR